jgi:translation initiation factor 1A
MGKNFKGGSKHKKYARNRNAIPKNKLSHLKKTENQEYAFIKDVLGNCRFRVICWDKKERLGILRGKMRKRQWVNRGELVLVSLREFQDDKCEIIQKYSTDQGNILIKNNLISESFAKEGKTFDDENDNDKNTYTDKSQDTNTNTNTNTVNEITIDDINFDDI